MKWCGDLNVVHPDRAPGERCVDQLEVLRRARERAHLRRASDTIARRDLAHRDTELVDLGSSGRRVDQSVLLADAHDGARVIASAPTEREAQTRRRAVATLGPRREDANPDLRSVRKPIAHLDDHPLSVRDHSDEVGLRRRGSVRIQVGRPHLRRRPRELRSVVVPRLGADATRHEAFVVGATRSPGEARAELAQLGLELLWIVRVLVAHARNLRVLAVPLGGGRYRHRNVPEERRRRGAARGQA